MDKPFIDVEPEWAKEYLDLANSSVTFFKAEYKKTTWFAPSVLCTRSYTVMKTGEIGICEKQAEHICEICQERFCINCMYLTCKICHREIACHGCGFPVRNEMKTCKRHVNVTLVNCEVEDCMCKEPRE